MHHGLELPLVAFGPRQLHLLAERRRQEPGGEEPVGRAEDGAERPGQIPEHDELVQVGADRRVDPDRGQRGVPIAVECGPVGWPPVGGHLQGGAKPAGRAVDGLGSLVIGQAAQQRMHVAHAPVQARGDPQLKLRIERAVTDRAVRGRADLCVGAVHHPPAGLAVPGRAHHGRRQIGDRAPPPPQRMAHHLGAADVALQHAIPDLRPAELHDHIRGSCQQARAVHQVPGTGPW